MTFLYLVVVPVVRFCSQLNPLELGHVGQHSFSKAVNGTVGALYHQAFDMSATPPQPFPEPPPSRLPFRKRRQSRLFFRQNQSQKLGLRSCVVRHLLLLRLLLIQIPIFVARISFTEDQLFQIA